VLRRAVLLLLLGLEFAASMHFDQPSRLMNYMWSVCEHMWLGTSIFASLVG
jgi:hypothetical protein